MCHMIADLMHCWNSFSLFIFCECFSEIQEDLDDLRHSVSDCRPTISDSVEKTIQNLTTQYLGEGQCDNPCEPNPCAYLGTCSKEGDYGYTCKCLPGYTGRNCETGELVVI